MIEILEILLHFLVIISTVLFKTAFAALMLAFSAFIIMLIAYGIRTWNEVSKQN